MLNVFFWSPPVPTMSMYFSLSSMAGTPVANMPSRKPNNSSTDMPRICSPVSSAAICSCGYFSSVIPIRMSYISCRVRVSPSSIFDNNAFICLYVVLLLMLLISKKRSVAISNRPLFSFTVYLFNTS